MVFCVSCGDQTESNGYELALQRFCRWLSTDPRILKSPTRTSLYDVGKWLHSRKLPDASRLTGHALTCGLQETIASASANARRISRLERERLFHSRTPLPPMLKRLTMMWAMPIR